MRSVLRLPASVLLALLALLAWPAMAGIVVHEAWVRAGPPSPVLAGYLDLQNDGSATERLIAVESPAVSRIELHQTVREDGMARMRAVEAIVLEPGERLSFGTQGYHLMLFLGDGARPEAGSRLPLTLRFEGQEPLRVDAVVRDSRPADHGGEQ